MKKERIEKLLLTVIGRYLQTHISSGTSNGLVSITAIKVAPTLDLIQVYLGFLGKGPSNQAAFLDKITKEHHWRLKKEVAQCLRHKVHRVPGEIRFYIDSTGAQASALMRLLNAIK